MTVLLCIATFLFFATLDWVLTRRQATRAAVAPAAAVPAAAPPVAAAAPEPVWVGGYRLPEQLHYHPGHTWARVTGPDTVTVGVDDFARRLIGRVENVKLPSVGQWLRQGAQSMRLAADGRAANLVAPVSGEVVEVNRDVKRDASALNEDPYGRGWLFKVKSADLAASVRGLLSGSLARRWTEDAREQLELRLMALSGSVLQDGGEPAPDFAEHLPREEWDSLVATFLLT